MRMRLRPADPSSAVRVAPLRCKKKQFLNFKHNRVKATIMPSPDWALDNSGKFTLVYKQ